nr:MAG TPA: hypothetical protein [Caudoviricetes sp.]
MNKYQATIFSTDSDIYTALQSNKIKLSEKTIRQIAFNRGVLFSSAVDRDSLIEKVSELPFSYSHVVSIQDKLATDTNHEIYSILRVYEGFDVNKLYDVVEAVIKAREVEYKDEKIEHHGVIGGYNIDIKYTEYDFRRGKFQQKKLNGGKINFIKTKHFTSIRFTQTKKIKSVLDDILNYYKAKVLNSIVLQYIDMSHISEQTLRNMFAKKIYDFDNHLAADGLIYAGLEKVRLSLIKVFVEGQSDSNSINGGNDSDSGTELDVDQGEYLSSDLNQDIEETDSEGSDENNHEDDKDSHNRVFKLNNASYDGHSLVDAKQIEELCDEGFYRSLIRWKSKVTFLQNNPIVTFEIGFVDKHYCKDIKIKILHKQYSYSYSGEDKEKIESHEFDQIIKVLEERVFIVNDMIIEELAKLAITPMAPKALTSVE